MAATNRKNSKPSNGDSAQQEFSFSSGHSPFWQSSLFNETYLENDVPSMLADLWQEDEAGPFAEFCNKFRNLSTQLKSEDLNSWSERKTINRLVKPILKMLGYLDNCGPDQEPWAEDESFSFNERKVSRTYRPDLIIVDHPGELKYIERKRGEEKLKEAKAIQILPIECKYWGRIEASVRSEDEDGRRADKRTEADSTRALDFDEQALKYMEILGAPYGVLTDGKIWRLYNLELSSDQYKRCFQFNLGHLIRHVNAGLGEDDASHAIFLGNAKYFYYVFGKRATFKTESGPKLVDDYLEYSKKYVSSVEEDLKARFVKAMAHACNGLLKSAEDKRQSADLQTIRDVAESHLFNLLFLRYCESRGILPLRQSPEYRKMSISNTIDKLEHFDPRKDGDGLNLPMLKAVFGKDFSYTPHGTELYDRLLKLTKMVQDGGAKSGEDGFSIEGFRQGIFNREEWRYVQDVKISNSDMVRILFELGYGKSGVSGRKYQQIPYSYFSPRQLGSIYESFLEFKLERASSEMAFVKKQWKPVSLKSSEVKDSDVPKVHKGDLFFTPDNEERKATGAYYTPDYVVRFIVSGCIGPLVDSASPSEILDLKICDPAMGSGHFLNGTLNYLAQKYLEAVERETCAAPEISLTEAKQKIVHRCLFGVDINPRAVKLAKMSLWLESASPGSTLQDLDSQLVCGDSVTGTFGWKKTFKFLRNGGFDAIVGNPPYRKERESKELLAGIRESEYGKRHYESKMDLWYFFLHRALDLVKPLHRIGYIVPSYWVKSSGSKKLISRLAGEGAFRCAIDFRKNKVFKDVSGQHMIFVIEKAPVSGTLIYQEFLETGLSEDQLGLATGAADSGKAPLIEVESSAIYRSEGGIDFEEYRYEDILGKLNASSTRLEGGAGPFRVAQGVVEAPDRVQKEAAEDAGRPKLAGKGVFVLSDRELFALRLNPREREFVRPYIHGEDVKRFNRCGPTAHLIYTTGKDNKYIQENKSEFPNLVAHLDDLAEFVTSSNKPYGLHRARDAAMFQGEKLLCHNMFAEPSFAYTSENAIVNFAFNVVTKVPDCPYSLKYLLGLLNSRLGAFWLNRKGKRRGVSRDVGVEVLRGFPVAKINFDNRKDRAAHDKIVEQVEVLERLIGRKAGNRSRIEREEKKLNSLVYGLYSLSQKFIERLEEADQRSGDVLDEAA